MKQVYAARPINTYRHSVSASVGDAYIAWLGEQYPEAKIIDPNSPEISAHADKLVEKARINPETGEEDEAYFNQYGSAKVMKYFTEEVVLPCNVGTGLMLPMKEGVFGVGAGVAAELAKMNNLGRPVFLVGFFKDMRFEKHHIIGLDVRETIDSVSNKPLYSFHTYDGARYYQLSVDETRARMYTSKPDGGWDRNNLQPYFLA